MKKIAFAFITALAVLSFAGCKKKGDEALGKWEGWKKEMCECKDKACAEAVQKKVTDWSAKQPAAKADDKAKPDPKMEAVSKAYGECMTKLMMPPMDPAAGGAPPADPAAGGTPPPAGGAAPAGGTEPPAGGTPPPAGGDMKKEEPKKEEPKK